MKHNIHHKNQTQGFALIEVMMAALVLTVGCLAFLKLQQTGIQYSFNDYARSQGVAITQGFAEKLRGNIAFTDPSINSGSIVAGDSSLSTSLPQETTDCTNAVPGKECAKAILAYQSYLTSQQMKNLIKGDSILCYQKGATPGSVRLTFIWLDTALFSEPDDDKLTIEEKRAKREKIVFSNVKCPTEYGKDADFDNKDNDFLENSVTIYAQL